MVHCFQMPTEHEKYLERERTRRWRERHMDQSRAIVQRYKAKLKKEVMEAYGNKCACCGESEPQFLTIDHINGDGKTHRKTVSSGFGGYHFYLWLRKNHYPEGFQILCW